MLKAKYFKYTLNYIQPIGTSRGYFDRKNSWYLVLYDSDKPFTKGIGECSVVPGLSIDDIPGFDKKLNNICDLINNGLYNFRAQLYEFPSIQFGLETAMKDLENDGSKELFPSAFTKGEEGIPINGLIWMGNRAYIEQQIEEKLRTGFTCIKMKIGTLDLDMELEIIESLRNRYSEEDLTIRVDANGAFKPKEAKDVLYRLADLQVHSIEQPIMAGQLDEMARLCQLTPIPIALDEELLAKYPVENKKKLLEIIKPQYIVIKPGLIGGFRSAEEWIELANNANIGWWITSALESNIGLNAIAQWTYTLDVSKPQGLGTGMLYANNITSPLAVIKNTLRYFPLTRWDLNLFT